MESFNFSFFSITGWGIDLDYHDVECFALGMNRDHSVIFEIASKHCISDSFVDHDGYSICSEGFLPTVVEETQVGVARGHQRADTLKPYSQKTSQSNHTRTTALSNSMKLSHARGSTQDR